MWGLIVGIIAGVILTIVGAIGAYNIFEFDEAHTKEFEFEYNEDYETMQKNKEGAKTLAQTFADSAKGHNARMSEKSNKYVLTYETKNWGKITGISLGVLAIGAIVAGLFVIFASITVVPQNAVALYRNKITGELSVVDTPGTMLKNPLTEKLVMSTAQTTVKFGDEEAEKGTAGYFPIHTANGQVLNIATEVKYSVDDPKAGVPTNYVKTLKTIYRKTKSTAIDSDYIKSIIHTTITQSAKDFATSSKNAVAGASKSATVTSDDEKLTIPDLMDRQTELRKHIEDAINDKLKQYDLFLIDGGFTITDIKPGDKAQEAIDSLTQSSTAAQIKTNEGAANIAEQTAREQTAAAELKAQVAEAAVKAQEALNNMISDPIVTAALDSAGINLHPALAYDDENNKHHDAEPTVAEQIKAYNIKAATDANLEILDLAALMLKSKQLEKWNGELPKTYAGDKTPFALMGTTS